MLLRLLVSDDAGDTGTGDRAWPSTLSMPPPLLLPVPQLELLMNCKIALPPFDAGENAEPQSR